MPVTKVRIGSSFRRMAEWIRTGPMIAVMPRMRAMLTMFDPYAFPKAMPEFPWRAAKVETTNSGAEVPKPTMTIPIRRGGIPKNLAVWDAPSTNRSELHNRSKRPTTNKTVLMSIIILYEANKNGTPKGASLWVS